MSQEFRLKMAIQSYYESTIDNRIREEDVQFLKIEDKWLLIHTDSQLFKSKIIL